MKSESILSDLFRRSSIDQMRRMIPGASLKIQDFDAAKTPLEGFAQLSRLRFSSRAMRVKFTFYFSPEPVAAWVALMLTKSAADVSSAESIDLIKEMMNLFVAQLLAVFERVNITSGMSLPNARTNNEKAFPKTPGGTILIPWTIGDSDCQIAVCAEVEMLADDLVVQSGEALREALQAEWDRADLSPLIKLQAE